MGERILRGRLVSIRQLRRTDASALGDILRDRQVTRMLPARVRRESGREFVARVLREQQSDGGFSFAIQQVGTAIVVGQVRIFDWSRDERQAEVGYWLRRKYWGRGYGTEALRLICRFGFRSMRLHRLVASVVVGNDRSARMPENLGFRREGRGRRSARLAAGWADVWTYGLLRGELRNPGAEPKGVLGDRNGTVSRGDT